MKKSLTPYLIILLTIVILGIPLVISRFGSKKPQIVAAKDNALYQSSGRLPYLATFGSKKEVNQAPTKITVGKTSITMTPEIEVKEIKKENENQITTITLDSTKFIQTLKETGVKEEIIIQKPVEKINFVANLEGVKPTLLNGLWHFLDEEGKEQFFIPQPFMEDAKGERSEAVVVNITQNDQFPSTNFQSSSNDSIFKQEKNIENFDIENSLEIENSKIENSNNGYMVTITPDNEWLNDPHRVYPVTIDPTLEVPKILIQELFYKRNATSKTYNLNNGKFVWEGSIGPVHYQDEQSAWQDIDTTVENQSDDAKFNFQNKKNSFQSHFKDKPVGNFIRFKVNDAWVKFKLENNPDLGNVNNVEAVIADNTVTYPNTYDGVDLKYTVPPTRLLEEYIIAAPATAAKISELEQKFMFQGTTYEEQPDGSINFLDSKTGEFLWRFPKPVMYELNEREDPKTGMPIRFENYGLHYEIKQAGSNYFISKVLDQEGRDWLVDLQRQYPVVIDATLTLQPDATDGIDNFLQGYGQAGDNYGTWTYIGAGKYSETQEQYLIRTLIKFDLSSLPNNAIISSATLSLYAVADYSSNARTFRVFRQKRAWTELGSTWNKYDGINSWQTAGGFGANDCEQADIGSRAFTATETLNEFKNFPLTATTKNNLDWGLENSVPATGWLLKADTEYAPDRYDFASSDNATAAYRPKLVVEYSIPAIRFEGLKMEGIKID